MIQNERKIRHELVLRAARRMMTIICTISKSKGTDIIGIAMVADGGTLHLFDEMTRVAAEIGFKSLLCDAENIKSADTMAIIGTSQKVQDLNYIHCGFDTCMEKPDLVPRAINSVDLGIAIGSTCAMAAGLRADTRVMSSTDLAAQRLGLLKDCKCVVVIPVSVLSENPFFDRRPKEEPKN